MDIRGSVLKTDLHEEEYVARDKGKIIRARNEYYERGIVLFVKANCNYSR